MRGRAAGRRRLTLLIACLGGLLQSGCGGDPTPVSQVLEHDQCQGLNAGVTRVDLAALAGIRGSRLLGEPAAPSRAPVQAPPGLLLAISRGRQPTPGYSLRLLGAHRQDGVATVEVHWETPASGAVLPQTITHPCLVVALPPLDFKRVEVRDQRGRLIGALGS